jgi:hypothetical protein
MRNPFRYFNSSPEVIRLTVVLYVRYPLSPVEFERQQNPRTEGIQKTRGYSDLWSVVQQSS